MTAVSYVPPNVLPPFVQKFAPLLRRRWFRELVLTPPTLTGHRFSNKTEDYGVFKPSWIAHIGQVSIYVQDIARSRRWYERLAPAAQPNLRRGGSSVQGGLAHSLLLYERWRHDECLALVEERDPAPCTVGYRRSATVSQASTPKVNSTPYRPSCQPLRPQDVGFRQVTLKSKS